jgi:hypothetical protein
LEKYVTSLLESELPFDAWVAALVWVALFLANHWTARSTRAANDAQTFIAVEDWSALRRGYEPKYIVAQVLFAGIVFLFAWLLGRSAFAFFAGGLIVAMAYGLALNVQGLLSARALARANAASGVLTFSTPSAFRHMAHRVTGGALGCLLMGLALAHLALLGGALFLASTAGGYFRRARNARAQP